MTILNLKNVNLHLGEKNNLVLSQIDYKMKTEDFVILLGSNGSGKSSLLKLLHRQYQPSSGEIHFLGKPMTQFHSKDFSHYVTVLTQNCADTLFTTLTVYENFLLVKRQKKFTLTHHKKEREFLRNYLFRFNANLTLKLDCIVDALSGGEKQALALAFCLLHPPSLLLLDEHTSALDPKTANQIMELTQKIISEHRMTCILTTHNLDIALRYGNRILMLHEGKILNQFDQHEKMTLSKELLLSSYSAIKDAMSS